jgi:NAD(P)H dehydrogenase (quinone)
MLALSAERETISIGGWQMNRRELLRDVGVAAAAASPLLANSASQAQAPSARANVLIAYHSVTGNTEKMAQGVAEGAKAVPGTNVVLKRVGEVAADDLLSSDAVIVGSPVYFGNMSGEAKTFFDNWLLKFDFYRNFKMRNKVGGAFATGGSISNGKEITMMAVLEAMLINQMIVVSGGGPFGFGASATTGPDSPGIDEKELAAARELGKRVAEVAATNKRGLAQAQ